MIAIAARREALRAAPTDFGEVRCRNFHLPATTAQGRSSEMRPMSDDLEPLLGQPTVFATRRFPHYPTASAWLWRASTKPKEQGNTEGGETAAPHRARSSHQAGRPAAGKANLRDAGRSWGAADDDGFPAREEREQTEDDRARGPDSRMPAAAPSWRQCCEIMRPMEPPCRVTPSPLSRALGATGEVCAAVTIQ
jgi:hypothetical protein